MTGSATILVIIGSTRVRRIGPHIADWVAVVGRSTVPHRIEIVDLKDWPLPMDDEPGIPAAGGDYAYEHTRAWSRKIAGADGFVFVTPQYNRGYPAPLKNALDHLYTEWVGKPAMIVTYGGHGGGGCAAQLRQVLDGLKVKPVESMPALHLARPRIEANDGRVVPEVEFADHADQLRTAFAELAASLALIR